MAVPPSTAEVKGHPPDPLPSEKPNVHALSTSDLAAMNLYIQTAAIDKSQHSKSSSPASGSLTLAKKLQQHDPMARNPLPNTQLKKSFSEKAADLGQISKLSSPTTVVHPPATGDHPPSYSNAKKPAAMVPSFVDVAKNGSVINKSKSGPSLNIFGEPPPLPGANMITKDGVDILVFEDEATYILAAPFKWALVGKFSHNLPNIQSVSKFFSNLKLRGEFELQWLSHRQILIVLSEEVDHALIWSRGFWFIDGCSMRTLKWTPTFNAKIESPFAPVWVSLPGLPVHLFDKRALYLLASQLGRPVMVDTPTASRKRARRARICVEINLLSPLKNVISLCINGCIIEQHVIFEDVPSYCVHCSHIGHDADKCFVKFEELKSAYVEFQAEKNKKTKGKNKLECIVSKNHHGSYAEVNDLELEEGEVVTIQNSKLGNIGLFDHANMLGLHDSGKGVCNDAIATVTGHGDVEQSVSVGVYIRGLEELEPRLSEPPIVPLHEMINYTPKNAESQSSVGEVAELHFMQNLNAGHESSLLVQSDGAVQSKDFFAVVDNSRKSADEAKKAQDDGPLSDGPGSFVPMQPNSAKDGHVDVMDDVALNLVHSVIDLTVGVEGNDEVDCGTTPSRPRHPESGINVPINSSPNVHAELHANNQITVYVPITTPLATIPPYTRNIQSSDEEFDDEYEYEFDDEMITQALLNKCLTSDGRKSASKDNFFCF